MLTLTALLLATSLCADTSAQPAEQPATQPEAAPQGGMALPPPPQTPDFKFLPDTLATIDGVPFTREMLIQIVDKRMKMDPQFAYLAVPQLKTKEMVRDNLLKPILDSEIALKLAEKEGFPANEATGIKFIDSEIANLPKEQRDAFEANLKLNNKTMESFKADFCKEKEALEQAAVRSWVIATIESKIKVNDEELKKFYDDHINDVTTLEASHILVVPDVGEENVRPNIAMTKATPEQKAAAKAKLENILKEIKAGKDFAEMAKLHSVCPSGKENGGSLGEFKLGQMDPAFEKATLATKINEVSDVFESSFGFHIVKKSKQAVTPFEEVKSEIERVIKMEEVQKTVTQKIEEAKKTIKIEILI